MLDTPLMLWELSASEQGYRAVLDAGTSRDRTEIVTDGTEHRSTGRLGTARLGTGLNTSGTPGAPTFGR